MNGACVSIDLSELNCANAQADRIFADLRHFSHPANLALKLRQIGSATQRTLNHWLTPAKQNNSNKACNKMPNAISKIIDNKPVNWHIRRGAYLKRIMLIVLDLMRVRRSLFARSQNPPRLQKQQKKTPQKPIQKSNQ